MRASLLSRIASLRSSTPPKQVVPSGKTIGKVVQGHQLIRMPWQEKCKSISIEQTCLIKVFYSPEQPVLLCGLHNLISSSAHSGVV